MDSAIPSNRLYPSHTVAELRAFLAREIDAAKIERLTLAIAQRDKASPAYVPTLAERLAAAR